MRGEKYLSGCQCGILSQWLKIMRAADCKPFVGKTGGFFDSHVKSWAAFAKKRHGCMAAMVSPVRQALISTSKLLCKQRFENFLFEKWRRSYPRCHFFIPNLNKFRQAFYGIFHNFYHMSQIISALKKIFLVKMKFQVEFLGGIRYNSFVLSECRAHTRCSGSRKIYSSSIRLSHIQKEEN